MSNFNRVVYLVSRGLMMLASLASILMCAFVAVNVIMRYIVGSPFRASDEFVGLLFVTASFLAMPGVLLSQQHIRITLLTDRYSDTVQRVVAAVAGLTVMTFFVVFGWLSFQFADFSYQINARSDVGRIWLYPWMMILPVTAALMALISFKTILQIALGHREAWRSSPDA